jgi:hypothetical protein
MSTRAFLSDDQVRELAARSGLSMPHLQAASAAVKFAWELVGQAIDHAGKPLKPRRSACAGALRLRSGELTEIQWLASLCERHAQEAAHCRATGYRRPAELHDELAADYSGRAFRIAAASNAELRA